MERGLSPSSEAGAEINELISQLEAHNPTEAPNEVHNIQLPRLLSPAKVCVLSGLVIWRH